MEVMGILNVTPDSFSDGGEHLEQPVLDALKMIDQGATIIDIGGQSTRPNAILASENQELERVIPVVRELSEELIKKRLTNVKISVDTTSAVVAKQSIENGATIINDVSCGEDLEMFNLISKNPQILYIMTHTRGLGKDMKNEHYVNVIDEVKDELLEKVNTALSHGIAKDQIIIDMGPGFSKPTQELNWPLISNLQEFTRTGFKVLVSASRKRFLQITDMVEDSIKNRDYLSSFISYIAFKQDAWGVRVHNVLATHELIKGYHLYEKYRHN